jgi:hypothetical protein
MLEKHEVSETGYVSILRCEEENANLSTEDL